MPAEDATQRAVGLRQDGRTRRASCNRLNPSTAFIQAQNAPAAVAQDQRDHLAQTPDSGRSGHATRRDEPPFARSMAHSPMVLGRVAPGAAAARTGPAAFPADQA